METYFGHVVSFQHIWNMIRNIGTQTIALVTGLDEQIMTDGYKQTILCDDSKACLEAVESGKADVAAGTRASLE